MRLRTLGTAKVRVSRAAGLTAVVVSLVLMTAAPAHAVGANTADASSGVGYEDDIVYGSDYGNPPSAFCYEVTANTGHVDFANNDLTANATDGLSATYTNAATFEWHIDQTMYVDFSNSYSAPETPMGSGCDLATLGDPIAATATFHGAGGGGEVTCASGEGAATFSRVFNDVTVTFDSICTVDGDGSQSTVTTPTSVTSTLTADFTQCFSPPNACVHSTYHDATYNYS